MSSAAANGSVDVVEPPGDPLEHLWFGGVTRSQLAAVGGPLVLSRGDGIYLWDENGNRYIDAIASLEAVAVGHGRPELAEAAARQYRDLAFLDTLRYTSRPAITLANRIAELAPGDLDAVHFACSGSEAVEAAIKIARQFHVQRGDGRKVKVIARRGAYHGCTFGAMAVDGRYYRTQTSMFEPANGFGRFVKDPLDIAEFADVIQFERPETVAAILIDPVATASGIYPAEPRFWVELRALCDANNVLLVADEVITGFGRTGRWFASDQGGVQPDLITVSKSLTSGYFPMSAVIASSRVRAEFDGEPHRALAHGHTFGGHPVAAAVALENLRIIDEEGLVDRADQNGVLLGSLLGQLTSHPMVAAVRGAGLLWGVQLRSVPGHAPPVVGAAVVGELRQQGALSFVLHPGNVLFVCPPLVITPPEIAALVSSVRAALDALVVKHPSWAPAR